METHTDAAFRILKAKNPSLEYNPLINTHEAMHVIGHPAYEGFSKKPDESIPHKKAIPSLKTSIQGELLVQITENVLYDARAVYDKSGFFKFPVPYENASIFEEEDDSVVSDHPLTVNEMRDLLEFSYVVLALEQDKYDAKVLLENQKFTEYGHKQEEIEEKRQQLEKDRRDGKVKVRITDQAIEYYMVRAQLIKQQMEAAGYSPASLQGDTVDTTLFAVSKEAVMEALEKKHGQPYSIKTPIDPSCHVDTGASVHNGMATEAVLVQGKGK